MSVAVAGLVAVVREIVERGHDENYPSGLAECEALRGRVCDCGWAEARAALDAYEAAIAAPGQP